MSKGRHLQRLQVGPRSQAPAPAQASHRPPAHHGSSSPSRLTSPLQGRTCPAPHPSDLPLLAGTSTETSLVFLSSSARAPPAGPEPTHTPPWPLCLQLSPHLPCHSSASLPTIALAGSRTNFGSSLPSSWRHHSSLASRIYLLAPRTQAASPSGGLNTPCLCMPSAHTTPQHTVRARGGPSYRQPVLPRGPRERTGMELWWGQVPRSSLVSDACPSPS